jgi:hypothetical protein
MLMETETRENYLRANMNYSLSKKVIELLECGVKYHDNSKAGYDKVEFDKNMGNHASSVFSRRVVDDNS